MAAETITYMGHLWLEINGDEITVGISDDTAGDITDIKKLLLPDQGEEFEADDICGEIETSDGPVNLFVPVTGSITEVNPNVVDEPQLILDDPTGEGWLFKVEAKDLDEVAQLKGSDFEN